jgi:hypothetical protein
MIHDSESHSRIQIEMAALGAISGTLAEWPHLKHALRQLGYHLPDHTHAIELRELCREILKTEKSRVPVVTKKIS